MKRRELEKIFDSIKEIVNGNKWAKPRYNLTKLLEFDGIIKRITYIQVILSEFA
jgi:hypothetical protein